MSEKGKNDQCKQKTGLHKNDAIQALERFKKKGQLFALFLTWFVDYTLMALYLSVGFYLFGDVKLSGNLTASLALFSYFSVQMIIQSIKELIYLRFLSQSVVSKKKKVVWNKELFVYYVSTTFFIHSIAASLAYLGFMSFPVQQYGVIKLLLLSQVEAFTAEFLRDIIGMKTIHILLHKKTNLYWLHKQHHKTNCEINVLTALYFDWFDVLFENVIGPASLICVKHFLFGQPMFVPSYLFQIHLDLLAHSVNPYSACFLNPIMDYFFRITVVHNLHHAVTNEYFLVFPWHQVFEPSAIEKDTKRYNKIMNTNAFEF